MDEGEKPAVSAGDENYHTNGPMSSPLRQTVPRAHTAVETPNDGQRLKDPPAYVGPVLHPIAQLPVAFEQLRPRQAGGRVDRPPTRALLVPRKEQGPVRPGIYLCICHRVRIESVSVFTSVLPLSLL